MSKITVKSTKEQMTSYLNEVFKSVQKANKNLADRIVYTAKAYKKDPASVMKKDLFDLCKEAMESLATPSTPVVAEASVKPKKKVMKKAETPVEKTEEEAETTPEPTEETPKAPVKKTGKKAVTKKSAKKEESLVTPKATNSNSKKEVMLADIFKEVYKTDTLGTLEIAHDIKTIEDLKKSYENEELLVFAMYWTPRHITQFEYGKDLGFKHVPKKFEDNVDLASLVYIGEVNDVAYAVSSETDRMYFFLESDLKEEDGMRFAGGAEYQIYRQTVEPQVEETEDDEE